MFFIPENKKLLHSTNGFMPFAPQLSPRRRSLAKTIPPAQVFSVSQYARRATGLDCTDMPRHLCRAAKASRAPLSA
jgi:hypothetical protein